MEDDDSKILERQTHFTPQVDDLLKSLVLVPEKTSLEIGITLSVNGLLISGFLISQQSYFDSLNQHVSSLESDAETKGMLTEFLDQLKNTVVKKPSEHQDDLPFIHLRDAKIYPSEGQGMPTFGHALWRGDIRAVNGFSLGEMVPAQIKNSNPQSFSS